MAGPFPPTSRVQVRIEQTGDSYACGTEESLLSGMLRLGRKGIPVGCINGGCGVCKVRVLQGAVRHLGPVSCAHVSDQERDQGYTLACRVAPLEAVCLEVTQRLRKPFFLGAPPPRASSSPTTHDTPTTN
ncbi:2Fe-2S iron-sulfur cluster-binding protein [Comamonas sp. GB3 AK4-5]|uniref:2Fe-2S iron-sulfur cluster-binding protein n=1 Tax=Comamonas sp. GB3 AK4-5 TaxID=3231487 RepID=UPI00351EFFEC